MADFIATFNSTNNEFDLELQSSNINFPTTFDTVVKVYDGDPYEGSYNITPRLTSQTFATNHKLMIDDLTVEEIPIVKTSNPQGGQTVLIG